MVRVPVMTASGSFRGRLPPTVGVLGGMGPLATVDFLHKLVLATPAQCDQDHLPLIVRFCPEIPDRMRALCGDGPSPEPALVAAARSLEVAGARCLVMPCNTAHAWHDAIAAALSIPTLHIVDCAIDAAHRIQPGVPIGLLATRGTRISGLYRQRSGARMRWIEPSAAEQEELVDKGIAAVKANRLAEGGRMLGEAARRLAGQGAGIVLMGCTEVPLALAGQDMAVPTVDSTAALAAACVQWALSMVEATAAPLLQVC